MAPVSNRGSAAGFHPAASAPLAADRADAINDYHALTRDADARSIAMIHDRLAPADYALEFADIIARHDPALLRRNRAEAALLTGKLMALSRRAANIAALIRVALAAPEHFRVTDADVARAEQSVPPLTLVGQGAYAGPALVDGDMST